MTEPASLHSARQHLARAEAAYRTRDGLFHLEEGLAELDEVVANESSAYGTIARNLAATYATRIYGRIKAAVETDRALPEPELEHLFKVVLAFDQSSVTLPPDARALKITVVRRLIDLYYEGHPAAAKQKALEQLAAITGEQTGDKSVRD
jgi:hypothetical protein